MKEKTWIPLCLLAVASLAVACSSGAKQSGQGVTPRQDSSSLQIEQSDSVSTASDTTEVTTTTEPEVELDFPDNPAQMYRELTEWLGYKGQIKNITERVYDAHEIAEGKVKRGKLLQKTYTAIEDWDAYEARYEGEDSITYTSSLRYMDYAYEQALEKKRGKPKADPKEEKTKHPEAYERYDQRGYLVESVYPHAYKQGVLCRAVYSNDRQGNPIRSVVYERQGKDGVYKAAYIIERQYSYYIEQ